MIPTKSDRITFILLAIFLGWTGAHHFYLHKVKSGLFSIVASAFGAFLLWANFFYFETPRWSSVAVSCFLLAYPAIEGLLALWDEATRRTDGDL
jgi:hypothetical protein